MPYKTFTIRDFIQAIRLNGYKQGYGKMIERPPLFNDTIPIVEAACAVGQAGLNLGVHPNDLEGYLSAELINYIMEQNDNSKRSCSEIADLAENEFGHILDDQAQLPTFDFSEYRNYQGVKI